MKSNWWKRWLTWVGLYCKYILHPKPLSIHSEDNWPNKSYCSDRYSSYAVLFNQLFLRLLCKSLLFQQSMIGEELELLERYFGLISAGRHRISSAHPHPYIRSLCIMQTDIATQLDSLHKEKPGVRQKICAVSTLFYQTRSTFAHLLKVKVNMSTFNHNNHVLHLFVIIVSITPVSRNC